VSTVNGCRPVTDDQKPFKGDRYERLRQAVEILCDDESVAAAELPFNGEGLRAFTADLIEMRALDGLSEHDANWAGMLACFDFCRGLPRFGWRINDMLSAKPTFIPRPRCDGDCPVSDVQTVTLACDLCGNQVRILPFDQCYAMFMAEWQHTHAVHHVYLDPPGTLGPPVTDCRWAPVEPCKEGGGQRR